MAHVPTVSVTCVGIATGVVLLSSIFSVTIAADGLLAQNKSYTKASVYSDIDGVATEQSTKAYSTKLPKASLIVFAVLGLASSIGLAVLDTVGSENVFSIMDYVVLAAWGMILSQSVLTVVARHPISSYQLGVYTGASSLSLTVALFIEEAIRLQNREVVSTEVYALRICRLGLGLITGLMALMLQRRPEVFTKDGKTIDLELTTTALSRYTFNWASTVMDKAVKQKKLELGDLPRPDHNLRSEDLAARWVAANRTGRLWVQIFKAHAPAFITQWVLVAARSFGNVAPQFMLLQILRILEERDTGLAVTGDVWIWVIALGFTQITANWLEGWLFWIGINQASNPVRSEMAALIFAKSMRRKDVKGDTGSKNSAAPDPLSSGPTQAIPENVAEVEDDKEIKIVEEKEDKSLQSTINLIGVDGKRVSDMALYQFLFPGSFCNLTVSLWFLVSIIGWKALGAGLLSMLVVIPINIYFSKIYTSAQSKLMAIRDEKEAAINEALKGIRQIKFSALEFRWQTALEAIRKRELDTLWAAFRADTALMFCWISSPIILSATALAVYSLSNRLTPSVAFTSIGIFNSLQVTLSVIPELTTDVIDALISVNRLQDYLESSEIDLSEKKDAPCVSFENATISFPSDKTFDVDDDRFVLRNVNVSFPEKQLSLISGKTGSGKSLLLAAILREADIISGSINLPRRVPARDRHDAQANKSNWLIPSAIAYVAQIPWIENATIKNNILFGLPFDKERYDLTLESCALKKDLDMLPDGERTEIGANGINLSGGQKWRLSFARALYSRAGILVLDDILSAVDTHVGRHIFEKGLTGPLGVGRTRILVTHHVSLCKPATKYLCELGDGTVLYAGLLSELEDGGVLAKILSHEEAAKLEQDPEPTIEEIEDHIGEEDSPLQKVDTKASARKFVEAETKEEGAVSKKYYGEYLKASGGWFFWTFACTLFLLGQAFTLGRSWWLRNWTQANESVSALSFQPLLIAQHRADFFAAGDHDEDTMYYLGGYVGISLGSAFLATFIFFWIFWGSVRASKVLFTRMLGTVIRAPLRWHDTVPLGRILNRFTADFNVVDSRLANSIAFTARYMLELVGILIAGFIISPYVVVLAIILACACVLVARRYLVGAREVKRLESIAKSPIFSSFGSSLAGISTIRAFDKTEDYIRTMSSTIDDYAATLLYMGLFNRWFTFRMATIGGIFSTAVAAMIVSLSGINAATAGFALSFALKYSDAVGWAIRQYTEVELSMNASERILEYCMLSTESQEGEAPPAAWPTDGRLEVHDLSVTYAPDLPPVLKNLSFSVERNQRVGVVGRTGAGKSSLTLALFRFLEAQTGAIFIDGVDISKVKLHDLRSRLAIIPQDPVLFSGTVRSNLDPFEERDDAELLDALQRVHLIPSSTSGTATPVAAVEGAEVDTNKNIFKSLQSAIAPSGLNLSQGQRQLLCLARAIVARPKVMVLDEATSAVDMATDTLIQRSIREEFKDSTLIVIAHRLSTIADFDKILVLEAGEVKEFGTPLELIEKEDGAFRSMVGDSGEKDHLIELIKGSK